VYILLFWDIVGWRRRRRKSMILILGGWLLMEDGYKCEGTIKVWEWRKGNYKGTYVPK
jgi:hypothetical protein